MIKIPNSRRRKCFVKAPREHSTIAISHTMSGSAIQQYKAGQGGARKLHKRRRGAEDLQSISRRVWASFPGESSRLVRVGPGHRSTALCAFSRVFNVVVWFDRLSLIKVQRKELACQEYLQGLLVIVPEPRPREADGFSSVRYYLFFFFYLSTNIRTFVRLISNDFV